MKRLVPLLLALLPMALQAGPSLKLELIGPTQAVPIDRASMDLAAATRGILERQREISAQADVDPKSLASIEEDLCKARALKQGVAMKLRFTNTGTTPIDLHYGPDMSRLECTLEGPGAVHLPYHGMMTMEYRMPPATPIAPGASVEFAFDELAHGPRDYSRWLIASPGTYTVVVRFMATLGEETLELRSQPVRFEVVQAGG